MLCCVLIFTDVLGRKGFFCLFVSTFCFVLFVAICYLEKKIKNCKTFLFYIYIFIFFSIIHSFLYKVYFWGISDEKAVGDMLYAGFDTIT